MTPKVTKRPFTSTLCILFLTPHLIYAEYANERSNEEPLPLGNFSLPFSQQPSPLVSFGENILDQGQVQLYLFGDTFLGKNNYLIDIIPSVLYGITDNLSLFFNVPFSPGNKSGKNHSSGIEDLFIQFEYAYYTNNRLYSMDQATVLANVTFPTGSSSKNPPTGFGACSFFMGATFNHTRVDWFFLLSSGGIITLSQGGTKFGDQILYQWGFGRNIPSPPGWIFAWMIEFDGVYSWKNKIKGTINPSSGGNVIYMTPSLWASSERFILQLGAGYPIVQHLFGSQSKQFLSFDLNIGYTF